MKSFGRLNNHCVHRKNAVYIHKMENNINEVFVQMRQSAVKIRT